MRLSCMASSRLLCGGLFIGKYAEASLLQECSLLGRKKLGVSGSFFSSRSVFFLFLVFVTTTNLQGTAGFYKWRLGAVKKAPYARVLNAKVCFFWLTFCLLCTNLLRLRIYLLFFTSKVLALIGGLISRYTSPSSCAVSLPMLSALSDKDWKLGRRRSCIFFTKPCTRGDQASFALVPHVPSIGFFMETGLREFSPFWASFGVFQHSPALESALLFFVWERMRSPDV